MRPARAIDFGSVAVNCCRASGEEWHWLQKRQWVGRRTHQESALALVRTAQPYEIRLLGCRSQTQPITPAHT